MGVIEEADGSFRTGPYLDLLNKIVGAKSGGLPEGFILTIGVVSNHGNWFTSDDQNKELRVLAQSYDWLLFLTDSGLAEFIDELLLNPKPERKAARDAFLASYSGRQTPNRFTKVLMDFDADETLRRYFADRKSSIESWFNVISPQKGSLHRLREDLRKLARNRIQQTGGI